MTGQATPTTNIIVPISILSMTPGAYIAKLVFGVDLKKQYYKNATIEFKVPEPTCLRMMRMPIYTALKMIDGRWQEIYDQDERFQQIGQVTKNPSWDVSISDTRHLLSTKVEAQIGMEYYSFVESAVGQYKEAHDVIMEVSGKSFVQPGYPKQGDGHPEYGLVDFELIKFDAIYIVPKGGPSGTMYLA